MPKVDEALARKVLRVVDKGLVLGLGKPTPGKMCVEAAVAYASGEDHNDNPSCVAGELAEIKIDLNDQAEWKTPANRAKGLRRLAIAQLGSDGKFDNREFQDELSEACDRYVLANVPKFQTLGDAGEFWAEIDTCPNSWGYVWSNVRLVHPKMKPHEQLAVVAEIMVQALIAMKIPGTKFLHLTEKRRK